MLDRKETPSPPRKAWPRLEIVAPTPPFLEWGMASRRSTVPAVSPGVSRTVARLGERLKALDQHPLWKTLEWEVRGMALQLMALGDFDTYHGTLPPEDTLWRAVLGLPSGAAIEKAMGQSVAARGRRPQQELDLAWAQWRQALGQWFKQIDAAFLVERPQYAACVGRWWHPLLDLVEAESPVDTPPRRAAGGRTRKASPSRVPEQGDNALPAETGAPAPRRRPKKKGDAAHPAGADGQAELDYPTIRFSTTVLRQAWDTPLPAAELDTLWATGARLLGGDTARAKSALGRLIKEFGEADVAAAVGTLSVRRAPVADPLSFLRAMLDKQHGDSPAIVAARKQRARVAL